MSKSSDRAPALSRDRLIESHLPLVRAIARRYVGRGETLDDLEQVGSLGLIRASERFDPARGVTFGTFAAPAIEGDIRRHLGERANPLRIPRELQRMSGELQRCRQRLTSSLGRAPSVDELAAALGVQPEDVGRALSAEQARASQASRAVEAGGEHERLSSADDRLLLAESARVLDDRERRIVFLRFHADMTERQIAREISSSQGTVSRLLNGALAKLREELADKNLVAPAADIDESPVISPVEEKIEAEAGGRERGEAHSRTSSRSKIGTVGAAGQKGTSNRSGRFLVRMPSTLHEELSHVAEREQVSLNRYVTDALAASISAGGSGTVNRAAGFERQNQSGSPARRTPNFRMLLAANVLVMVLASAAAIALVIFALQRGV